MWAPAAATDDAAEGGHAGGVRGDAAVGYAALYNALGAGLTSERAVLLLYALLHGCPRFHEYCLVRGGAPPARLPRRGVLHCLLTSPSPPSACWLVPHTPAYLHPPHPPTGAQRPGHTAAAAARAALLGPRPHLQPGGRAGPSPARPRAQAAAALAWRQGGGRARLPPRHRFTRAACARSTYQGSSAHTHTPLPPTLPLQMYMLLIILLMLSQDTAFAQNIHKIVLQARGRPRAARGACWGGAARAGGGGGGRRPRAACKSAQCGGLAWRPGRECLINR